MEEGDPITSTYPVIQYNNSHFKRILHHEVSLRLPCSFSHDSISYAFLHCTHISVNDKLQRAGRC